MHYVSMLVVSKFRNNYTKLDVELLATSGNVFRLLPETKAHVVTTLKKKVVLETSIVDFDW